MLPLLSVLFYIVSSPLGTIQDLPCHLTHMISIPSHRSPLPSCSRPRFLSRCPLCSAVFFHLLPHSMATPSSGTSLPVSASPPLFSSCNLPPSSSSHYPGFVVLLFLLSHVSLWSPSLMESSLSPGTVYPLWCLTHGRACKRCLVKIC